MPMIRPTPVRRFFLGLVELDPDELVLGLGREARVDLARGHGSVSRVESRGRAARGTRANGSRSGDARLERLLRGGLGEAVAPLAVPRDVEAEEHQVRADDCAGDRRDQREHVGRHVEAEPARRRARRRPRRRSRSSSIRAVQSRRPRRSTTPRPIGTPIERAASSSPSSGRAGHRRRARPGRRGTSRRGRGRRGRPSAAARAPCARSRPPVHAARHQQQRQHGEQREADDRAGDALRRARSA